MAPIIDAQLLRTIVDPLPDADADAENGDVALNFKSKNCFRGRAVGGTTMEGAGTYSWAEAGVTYKGDFVGSAATGGGTYSWADGCKYEGELVAGVRHGHGVLTGKGGFPRYEGQWREGRRHGEGTCEYRSGEVYEGQWADDMREGQGTLTHANGNVYKGAWHSDLKIGHGSFFWYDRREQYVGEWKDGAPHGHGEHVWLRVQSEGSPFQLRERFVGEWEAGERHGHGSFHYASGARYVGEWVRNQKHGHGIFSFEDGSVYDGPFEQDRMTNGVLRATSELYSYVDLTQLVPAGQLEGARAAVRNVFVRHNTDIKQVYRYYAALGCDSADAFVLNLSQFRTFAVDTGIASAELPMAALEDLIMRPAVDPSPTQEPPPPHVLAITVASAQAEAPKEFGAALAKAAKYSRGGVHGISRKLLLREFVQGLVEIAAAKLLMIPVGDRPKEDDSVHPLAQSLLSLIQDSILTATPTAHEKLDNAAAAAVPPEERARLELLYAHYAAAEPTPRCRRAPPEPTLTVRGYVRLLADAGLLPGGFSAPNLLAATLPAYYVSDAAAAAPSPGTVASLDEASIAAATAAAAESAEAEPAAVEGDEAPPPPPPAPPPASAPPSEALSVDTTEELLGMYLTLPEFIDAVVSFSAQVGALESPSWAPPPPPPPAAEGDEGDGEGEGEGVPDAKAAAEGEGEEGGEAAEEAEEAVPAAPRDAAEVLRGTVLPKAGAFLLGLIAEKAACDS
jgi:hypothetical protein